MLSLFTQVVVHQHLLSSSVAVTALLIGTGQGVLAQAPAVQWDRTFGGSQHEGFWASVQPTADGGFIVGGASNSGVSGDRSQPNRGTASDYWIIKFSADGTKQWDRAYGGPLEDVLWSVLPTSDGGYLLGGSSLSDVGGDKTQPSRGFSDYWLVKVDAQGNRQWDRAYGGNGPEAFRSMQQTADGGYVIGGYSHSGASGDKTQPAHTHPSLPIDPVDYWVLKLDAQGNIQWDRTYGGSHIDWFSELQQTADGGYILGGQSLSDASGDKSQALKGTRDYWIVKLDAQGNKQWDKAYGGSGTNTMRRVQQTPDGGYILMGGTNAGVSGDKSEPAKGSNDIWVVKVDGSGTKQWDRSLGGSASQTGYALQVTSDGGCLVGGPSISGISGDKTEANLGAGDYWVVKLNGQGTKIWDRTIGGSGDDQLISIRQVPDGSFILGGTSSSGISGNKTQPSQGGADFWVVKLSGEGTATPIRRSLAKSRVSVYPNPARQVVLINPDNTLLGAELIIRLVDVTGRSVWQKTMKATQKIELPVYGYPTGLYLLHLEGANGYYQKQQLVIE